MSETSKGPATLADVDGHYRVLLGRQPETAAVMTEMVGQELQGVHTSFIGSREFAERVFEPIVTGGGWPRELFAGAPDGAMVRWIAEQFGLDDEARDQLGRARNWHLAHLLIFRDGSVLRQHGNAGLVAQLTAYLYGLNKILGRSGLAVDPSELGIAASAATSETLDAPRPRRDLGDIDLADSHYDDRDQLHQDELLLAGSDVFDEHYYRWRAGIGDDIDAVIHYLLHGWRAGLDPGPHFDGASLRPFYASVGQDGPPALTFLMIQLQGWQAYPSVAAAQPTADAIRASDRFDADGYARVAGIDPAVLDPALHYLLVGERAGLAPSDRFDPVYYGRRNRDVVAHGSNLFGHYVNSGCREGRRPLFEGLRHLEQPMRLDPAKKTVLLTVHQASRTGAPILGLNMLERLKRRYNVITLMMMGGELLDLFEAKSDYVVGPLSFSDLDATELAYLVAALLDRVEVEYAIVNSIECRNFIPALAAGFVAVVTLMHEFACYTRPIDTMIEAMDESSAVVFPAPVVQGSALEYHPWLKLRATHILPQGPSVIPQEIAPEGGRAAAVRNARLERLLRPAGAERSLLVLGAGSIHIRKGVDLFIAAATALEASHPDLDFRFVWIGHGYDPLLDTPYSVYLAEQIARAGVKHRVLIIDEVDDLEPAYAAADLFFLSSRLDPLPNVSIDAALRGVPVICFDGGTGMADVLRTRSELSGCIVPYGDAAAAAAAVATLADPTVRLATSRATRRLARATFDMDSYLASIERLGVAGAETMRRRRRDAAAIAADGAFDESFFLSADKQMLDRDAAIRLFCTQWDNVGHSRGAVVDPYFRRPLPGFHPQVFAQQGTDGARGNPFANWIAAGKPAGPWQQTVILPRETAPVRRRAALHAHIYHPELIDDLLNKLAANSSGCDLLISTDRESKARQLRTATTDYGSGRVVIRVFPNRGRDVGPFLTGFRQSFARYDIIGHVHSKRSEDLGSSGGDLWREFLWQHLLGDVVPAMDLAFDALASDPALGLVYPADPHLSDWSDNREFGDDLARRMNIDLPLPAFFNFPIGTMFWARRAALQPMFDLALDWTDYPDEPLPYDGTLLHGLERMLPFAAAKAGFKDAVVHLPGINR